MANQYESAADMYLNEKPNWQKISADYQKYKRGERGYIMDWKRYERQVGIRGSHKPGSKASNEVITKGLEYWREYEEKFNTDDDEDDVETMSDEEYETMYGEIESKAVDLRGSLQAQRELIDINTRPYRNAGRYKKGEEQAKGGIFGKLWGSDGKIK